jgi:predicted Fe-Mo cluster-binding NifX family protein
MDTSNQLLTVDFNGKEEISRRVINIPELSLIYKADFLKNLSLNWLICGAITRQLYQLLASSDIKLLPFTRGSVDDILLAYINGELPAEGYLLPGFDSMRWKNKYRRKRFRRGKKFNS